MAEQKQRKGTIAITGATGLFGQEIVRHFSKNGAYRVVPLSHRDVEVTDPASVSETITKAAPDIIINCAVIIDVDVCEANQQKCYAVNRDGVGNLLRAAQLLPNPPTFVQVSSSEVFGRVNEGEYLINGYTEDDMPIPASAYQKSKKEAEDLVADFAARNPDVLRTWFVARAAWLFGQGRDTYVEQFVSKLQKKDPLSIIADQWRVPTWTAHAAIQLQTLLEGSCKNGIYHLVSERKEGEATTMDVIDEIKRYLGSRNANPPITLASRNDFFKIPRAPSNVLLNTKLPKLPYWRDALREYLTASTSGSHPE